MAVPSKMTQLVAAIAFFAGVFSIQDPVKIPKTGFNCEGRPSGYYADLETGCQVYHMCDGLGRQFSYSCPNTTLFQQRMLICDHWYMVNCSVSEKDYSANLLIGQRDKPFVSDSEDHQRTPRPDILSAPYAQGFNNYGGFQELNPTAGEKSIFDDSIANGHNDINDGVRRFPLPTHWSTELTNINRFTTASPVSAASKGFTGRPIVIQDSIDSNTNSLLTQSTENSKVISNFPAFERDQIRQTTNFQANNQKTTIKEPTQQNLQSSFDPQNRANSLKKNANANLPSKFLDPPYFALNSSPEKVNAFKSTTVKSIASFNNDFLSDFLPPLSSESSEEGSLRNDLQNNQDAVINFIKRFNNDEVSPKRVQGNQPSATQFSSGRDGGVSGPSGNGFEIQTSSETAGFATQPSSNNQISRTPSKTTQAAPSHRPPTQTAFTPQAKILNTPQQVQQNANTNKIETSLSTLNSNINSNTPTLSPDLLPPFENEYVDATSTTMGPIIYYEWKEAAPVMDLQPPFPDKENNKDNIQKRGEQNTKVEGKPEFAKPRPTTTKPVNQVTERSTPDQTTSEGNTDFKVSSYFVPDYVFPLDKEHPGYEEDDALTSFQVKIPHTIDNNEAHPYYGENAQCPQCHPSFVVPGTCKPCVMIRR